MAIIQGNAHKSSVSGFYPKTIEGSLRFNDDDSAYLSWTPDSAGDRKTWTWSGWVKRAGTGTRQYLFSTGSSGTNYAHFMIDSDDKLYFVTESSLYRIGSTAKFRDHSAWYHFMFVMDTPNSTTNDRMRYYVNGERVDVGVFNTQPTTQNLDMKFNQAASHSIGKHNYGAAYADCYMADVYFIDGQALSASDFGETKNGVWVAKNYAGTFGTNGFHLTFEDDGVNAFYDYTGNYPSKTLGAGLAHTTDEAKWGSSSINSEPTNAYYTITGTNGDLYPSGSNDRTFETWVYYDNTGVSTNNLALFYSYTSDYFGVNIFLDGGTQNLRVGNQTNGGSNLYYLTSSSSLSSGWNHVAVTYQNKTGTLFLNGNQVGQNIWASGTFGDSGNIQIGSTAACDRFPYMDDVRISSGLRYTGSTYTVPTAEFEVDSNTLFMLKSDYAPSTAVGADSSGNNNHWTDNNLTHFDVVLDSPTDNFATLNALVAGNVTLSDGNLKYQHTGSWTTTEAYSTIAIPEGLKFYFEVFQNSVGGAGTYCGVGITSNTTTSTTPYNGVGGWVYLNTGAINHDSSTLSTQSSYTTGDTIGVAVDRENGTVKFYKNNTLEYTVSDSDISTGDLFFTVFAYTGTMTTNFGQQPFTYDPPE